MYLLRSLTYKINCFLVPLISFDNKRACKAFVVIQSPTSTPELQKKLLLLTGDSRKDENVMLSVKDNDLNWITYNEICVSLMKVNTTVLEC